MSCGRVARWTALLAAVACAGCTSRPNVVLLVIDTLRADHVHAYGYARETTPHLDRLLEAGVRFDAAIAHSSWSAPSHVSIVTGTLPATHEVGNWGDALPKDVPPLAALLRDAGYATGLFSSHYALHRSIGGLQRGLDVAVVQPNRFDREVLQRGAAWAARQQEPYFLYAVIMTPHAPYNRYPASYDESLFLDVPPGGERTYPFSDETWLGDGSIPASVRLQDRRDVGFYVNRYDRAVRYADELVGEFLARLDEAGRLDDTLLLVTSDHGEGLGDHDTFAHELYLYDFLVRVPLILHHPDAVRGGRVVREPVQHVDLVPTILGFAGLPVPPHVEGLDLSRALRDGAPLPEGRLTPGSYLLRGFERYMVRSASYKLLFDAKSKRQEFYHLASDPGELHDLLQAETGPPREPYRTHLAELERLVERHRERGDGGAPPALPDDVLRELEALGYVEPR